MSEFLKISELNIGYKNPLTKKINLCALDNDFICITGRNGTGKSTLLNTISGVSMPLDGKITIKNQNINKLNPTKRSKLISYVPSKQEFLSNLRLIDLVEMGRSPYTNIFDRKNKKDKLIIENALNEFSLSSLANKKLFELSDGERQRAMICRAFVQETPIILLDEPTAFLDYFSKHKLLQTLNNLSVKQNRCIIFSSHDLEVAFKFVDKIWLFNKDNVESHKLQDIKQTDLLEDVLSFKF